MYKVGILPRDWHVFILFIIFFMRDAFDYINHTGCNSTKPYKLKLYVICTDNSCKLLMHYIMSTMVSQITGASII